MHCSAAWLGGKNVSARPDKHFGLNISMLKNKHLRAGIVFVQYLDEGRTFPFG